MPRPKCVQIHQLLVQLIISSKKINLLNPGSPPIIGYGSTFPPQNHWSESHERTQPRMDLRYHSPRRRAVPGLLHDRPREAQNGRKTCRPRRRHPRSRFPHRLSGRFRSRPGRLCGIPVGPGRSSCSLHLKGRGTRRRSSKAGPPSPHPHLPRHQRHSPQVQAQEVPPAGSR